MTNLHWPRYKRSPKTRLSFRGPNRILTLDEQLEIQRVMKEAAPFRQRLARAEDAAERYGVSVRTIWRYAATIPVPPGLEVLRMRIVAWADERDLQLTYDDYVSLLHVISRHRDMQGQDSRSVADRARDERLRRMRRASWRWTGMCANPP